MNQLPKNKHGITILPVHNHNVRNSVDNEQRRAVYKKTGGHCVYCGKKLVLRKVGAKNYMTIDHATAKANGGNNDIDNVLPCCKQCNLLKGNMPLPEFLCLLRRIENNANGRSV